MVNVGTTREGSSRNADVSIQTQRVDVKSMEEKLENLSRPSTECCIYEVPKQLRRINEEAYTPVRVSIGPIHHDKKDLQPMEEHKWRYLQDFLGQTQKPLKEYVKFIEEREDEIRECYAETINIKSHEFVEIILVDAAFIIELLLRYNCPCLRTPDDRIFKKPWMVTDINRDMRLLENQLPFFILQDLFGMANTNVQLGCDQHVTPDFIELTHNFFVNSTELLDLTKLVVHSPRKTDSSVVHFIDLLRSCLIPREKELPHTKTDSSVVHFIDLLGSCLIPREKELPTKTIPREKELPCTKTEIEFIQSATELHEAGVKLVVGSRNNLFDIKFNGSVLEIPHIKITDSTECFLRNLIAFEQCHYGDRFVTDYAILMDCLINTSKDVELLVKNKIIENWLGDSKDVMKLFNKLCKEVVLGNAICFSQLYIELNAYCKIRRHKWKATLRHNYCNTPWRVLSIVVAFTLLMLTFIQTICSLASL